MGFSTKIRACEMNTNRNQRFILLITWIILIYFYFSDTSSDIQSEFKLGPGSEKETKITSLVTGLQSLIRGEVTGQHTSLTCRSIRIGSYKTLAKEKVHFTQKAIYIRVPYLTDPKRMITLVIPATDILRIEMLSGRSMPLIFISTTPRYDFI